jgi:hypothetical protein
MPRRPAHACSSQSAPRGRAAVLLSLLLFSALCLNAGTVIWTLNATFSDGGTASGTFIFDADTAVFSDWSITTSGGNTSTFPALVFSPSNSGFDLFGPNPNALQVFSKQPFPDPNGITGMSALLEILINPSSPLSDSGGALTIVPGDFSAECLSCFPSRSITSGTLSGKAAPDLSIAVADNSYPSNPIGGSIYRGASGGTFTATISNVGTAPTSGTVTVTNVLSAGLTATGISGGASWQCTLSTLVCTRSDSLAVSGSYPPITVTVTTSVTAPGGVTDTVSVAGGGDENTADNTAQDYTTTFTEAQVQSTLTYLKPPADFDGTLLMTDGTILVHEYCTPNWYKLTPNNLGSYANGTWSQAASMPAGFGPFAFASAVLPDDRVVVIGGEYNEPCSGSSFDVNLGAIYDPKADSWTALPAPSGWTQIGDASSVVLPNGQFMLAGNNEHATALLDPVTLTWTVNPAPPAEEAGWTLLPDGSVLMPEIQQAPNSYRYIPASATWVSAGQTLNWISTNNEVGPQVLRPDGTVFTVGATGQTAIYNSGTQTWTAGPTLPGIGSGQLEAQDVPGALEPNGNVVFEARNSVSTFWFEFDGTNLNPTAGEGAGACMSLLPLPNGQIACSGSFVYTPPGSPNPAWAPSIAAAPGAVQPGQTYTITGTQFNGLSQAVGFGDDYQGATNYPLVRIVDNSTGHVFYCRTHNHSTMAVATGSALVSTEFDVPASIETGASTLEVVTNGIASNPVNLTVSANPSGVPILSGLSPSTAGAGLPAFTLTVNGSGFVSGAAVNWNGIAQPTTFVSASRLTAAISASLIATSGAGYVSVTGGGKLSNALAFTIQAAPAAFFTGQVSLGSGVEYLQFPDSAVFGYYTFVSSTIFYHYDMGYEAFVPGSASDLYLYDFASGHWWYTSNTLFPYLYDFSLKTWIYYFPNTQSAGHYTTNPRYFSNLTTGQIFTM